MRGMAEYHKAELQNLESEGKIEKIGNLKIYRYAYSGGTVEKVCLKIWRGKQSAPFASYSFSSHDKREEFVTRQLAADESHDKYKADSKAASAVRAAEMRDKIQVGSIFCNSWGYDQTNVDFYQVVAKKGSTVTLQEIGSREVEGSQGFMCRSVMPARDSFLEGKAPITKRISGYGVSFEHGGCSLCEDDSKHYESWYA